MEKHLGFLWGYESSEELTPEQEESELEFTQENIEVLMKNSPDFDTWVTEMVGDLENFTNSK